ncbi:MAG: CopD family protein [Thalassobaculum sp.]|uniref:CopD family protein n=1 Tax=Thalassobaculum sp. TaxID=2022740 RepID=UPI0032EF72FC
MTALLVALHIVAAVIWVGGMFFAYVVLRPSVGGIEPAAERPRLWRRVFARFFPWVSAAVLVLIVTGYALVFGHFGGMAGVGLHIHVMQGLGWIMFLLYGHLYFASWARFRRAVDAGDLQAAGPALAGIRRIVALNLALGLVVVAIGASGRYWP